MDIPSFKKNLIHSLSTLPLFEALAQNELMLVTAAGIIRGRVTILKIEPEAGDDTEKSDRVAEPEKDGYKFNNEPTESKKAFLAYYVQAARETYNKEQNMPEKAYLPGSDGGLCLHDVELDYGNGNVQKFSEMVVFYDQIIAVSLGKRE